jgi:hypothetical protein
MGRLQIRTLEIAEILIFLWFISVLVARKGTCEKLYS